MRSHGHRVPPIRQPFNTSFASFANGTKGLLLLCVLILCASAASATNTVYISQSGAGSVNGTNCANAEPWTYFNTSGNWSGSPTGIQIGPDTTVIDCGTGTGTAAATALTFHGSGTSGHPVTLKSDPTSCADLTAPYWSGSNGAINTNGFNFLVLDGSGTGNPGTGAGGFTWTPCGIIEDSANGTSSANQQFSIGFSVPSGNSITIKNWTCKNIYVRTGHSQEAFSETQTNCLNFGSGGTITNLTVTNNQFHDAGWIVLGNNSDNITFSQNDFYNGEHDLVAAPGHFYIVGNHFHDWSLWDTPLVGGNYPYHHDGIHCFAGTGGATSLLVIANNQFDGATYSGISGDGQFNQNIFIEGNTSATRCMVPGGQVITVNNVMVTNGTAPAIGGIFGNATTGDVNDVWVNNLSFGNSTSDASICGAFSGISGFTLANNACGNTGILMTNGGGSSPTFTLIDNNAYSGCTGFNCFFIGGVDTGSFTSWQASSYCTGTAGGCDPHGIASLSSLTYFALNSACTNGSVGQNCAPASGSPLINAGKNLFTQLGCSSPVIPGLGYGCTDINGNARPSSGAWWIGPFQTSGSASVATPTFSPIAGTYTSTQSVTISTTTGGATLCYTTDGTTPTANGAGTCTHGTTYTTAVSVAAPETLKAIGSLSGDTDSSVGSAAYVITVVPPTFSPVAGIYTSTQSVTISTTTGGATICYTTDGTTPTANGAGTCTHGTTYSSAVSVAVSLTLKAIGSLSGLADSAVISGAYTIAPVIATPTFSPVAGTYALAQSVTISTSTGGATLCYTSDGTTPTGNGAGTCTHGTTYSVPVSVSSSLTLKAIGTESGFTDSVVGSALYTIAPPPAPCNACMAAVPKVIPSTTSAEINWVTVVPTTATLKYGLTPGYGRKVLGPWEFVNSHQFAIVKLKPSTTYHLQLLGQDDAGNTVTTPDEVFATR